MMCERWAVAVVVGVLGVGGCGSHASTTSKPKVGNDAGPSGQCGNGTIDPGELCDGALTHNATCASLGFSGGNLGCSPSCQLDASTCTGGKITPSIMPSRATCAAPCNVSFDATGTNGLSGGDYVSANWNWDFNDPTSPHKGTIGFVVGHVFDNPGTYLVSARVRDVAGAAGWGTTMVTVEAMTGTTYYVAANGDDSNPGTDMAHPYKTPKAAIAASGAANNTLLLRRGDTFAIQDDLGGSLLSFKGPFVIGAYTDPQSQSSAAPILTDNNPTNGGFSTAINITGDDIRLTDVHFKASNGVFAAMYVTGGETLIERVESEGVGAATETGANTVNAENAVDLTVADCNFHDFSAYGIYASISTRLSAIGNTFTNFTGNTVSPLHGIRLEGGTSSDGTGGTSGQFTTNSYIGDNTILAESGLIYTANGFHGDNKNMVVVHNHYDRTISVAPTNTGTTEHVSFGLMEGNLLQNPTPNADYRSFEIIAQHITIRNNVMLNPDIPVIVEGAANLPSNWTDQIVVQNNTGFLCPPSGVPDNYPGFFASHASTTGSLVVQNNIYVECMPTGASALVMGVGTGKETIDHNLMYGSVTPPGTPGVGTGGLTTDPLFAMLPADSEMMVSSSAGFALRPGSPAIGAGTATTAFQDLNGIPRPQGGWDLGALQTLPASSPDAATH